MSKQNSSGLMSRSSAVKFRTVAISGKEKNVYCDQPFVSETTKCESTDFIEINDNSGQNVVRFLCVKDKEGARANYQRDRERDYVRERAYERERWSGYKDQDILINT